MANQATFGRTEFSVGDTVAVHHKFKEANKERAQAFTGIVIAIRGHEPNKSFTVRKIASGGIGVERIWPLFCPSISKIVVKKKGKVRRAKLYYLRERVGKEALKVREVDKKKKTLKTTEGTERKFQRAPKNSVVSVSKKNIRAKTNSGKTRRTAGKKTSP